MGIKLHKFKGDRLGPIVVCDKCGKRLNSGEILVALHKDFSFKTFCKSFVTAGCDPKNTDEDGRGWFEWDQFLTYLAHNTKLDPERVQELMDNPIPL